jgi:hypothetical protein
MFLVFFDIFCVQRLVKESSQLRDVLCRSRSLQLTFFPVHLLDLDQVTYPWRSLKHKLVEVFHRHTVHLSIVYVVFQCIR